MNWLIASAVAYFLLKQKGLDLTPGAPIEPVPVPVPSPTPASDSQDSVPVILARDADPAVVIHRLLTDAAPEVGAIPVSNLQACLNGFGRCSYGALRPVRGRWLLSRR